MLQASNSLPPRLFTTDTGKALSMPGNRSIARRTHRINDKRMTLRIKTAQLGQTLMPALVCPSLKLCQIGTLHLILHGVSCMKQEKRMSNNQWKNSSTTHQQVDPRWTLTMLRASLKITLKVAQQATYKDRLLEQISDLQQFTNGCWSYVLKKWLIDVILI